MAPASDRFDCDFAIVGSGFGGSVSALRLAEKGYRVLVLEMGKRWAPRDFPRSNWALHKFLWAPALKLHGILQLSLLPNIFILHGAGVGGGSLVYANTLLRPKSEVFRQTSWPAGIDWEQALAPHYETAETMLGVVEAPVLGRGDELLREIARERGREETFYRTRVGVCLAEPGQRVPDPYFGGQGPERAGCTFCGGCMVGCRVGAKNTLDRNYLYLAERLGARILPETRVKDIRPLAGGGYELSRERSTSWWGRAQPPLRARQVVLSAGVLGTLRLLQDCVGRGSLPALSPALGRTVRTNNEALVGAAGPLDGPDLSRGLAISAGFYPDDQTHIEVVRYPKGSDALAVLGTVLTGGGRWPRPVHFLLAALRHPVQLLQTLLPLGWARRTNILLCMQSRDTSLDLELQGGRWRARAGRQGRLPSYLPVANEVAGELARKLGGQAISVLPEVLLDLSSTAHILGGCAMADTPEHGVVDERGRVFGHPGLYVIDGSMVPCNLGVNPSLTITALAEYAMAAVGRNS